MADFDATPLITGVGTGVGGALIGFLSGRRKSKAEAALLEAQAVSQRIDNVTSTIQIYEQALDRLHRKMEAQNELIETFEARLELLEQTRDDHYILMQFVADAWEYYRKRDIQHFEPSDKVLAIMRPELARRLRFQPASGQITLPLRKDEPNVDDV